MKNARQLSPAKRAMRKKAIAREFDMKRRELGLGAPAMKKGFLFYALVIFLLVAIGSVVLKQAGVVDRRKTVNTKMLNAQRSVNALAEALGRFRFHCGCYPSEEDGGLAALSSKTSRYPGWIGPYASGSWGEMIPDPWKRPYIYEPRREGHPAVLSLGPDGIRGTADDVLPDDALFDKPFRDVSWTNDWVHFSRRGIFVVPKKSVRRER